MTNAMPESAGWLFDEYDGPRFWQHVDFFGGTAYLDDPLCLLDADAGQCWTWTGWGRGNYGYFTAWGKDIGAHRLAFRDQGGRLPDDLDVDHLCRNTRCVRKSHLEAVTHAENVGRGLAPIANRTVCRHGHELTPDNIATYRNHGVEMSACLTCRRASRGRSSARRKLST